jgi:hypothetical protein
MGKLEAILQKLNESKKSKTIKNDEIEHKQWRYNDFCKVS